MKAISDQIQVVMHQNIMGKYGRNGSLVIYDTPNYYFATDRADESKRVDFSKERRIMPIVQMGLLIDQNKTPTGYHFFPTTLLTQKR